MDLSSKDLVNSLLKAGIEVKNHMSTMEEAQVSLVRSRFKNGKLDLTTPKPEKKPAALQHGSQPSAPKEAAPVHRPPVPAPAPKPAGGPTRPDALPLGQVNARVNRASAQPPAGSRPAQSPRPEGENHAPRTERAATERPPQVPRPAGGTDNNYSNAPRPGNNQRPPGGGQYPPQNGPRPVHSEQRPSGSNQPRPAAGGTASPGGARPQNSGGRPAGNGQQRPSQNGQRPPQNSQQRPPQNGQRPPQNSQRPPQNGPRPPFGGSQPRPSGGGQRPGGNNQAPGGARPAAPGRPAGENRNFGPNAPAGGKPFNSKNKPNNQAPQQKRDYSRPSQRSKPKKKDKESIKLPDKITLTDSLQVREFAEMLYKPSAEIIKKLMELGSMVTMNQAIDYDTMEILAGLYGVEVEHAISREERILEQIVDPEGTLVKRPPIVTVMGHVDHGKTSLLDWVRRSNVVSGEAGGITQHIGAYQVKVNDELITFIDTPGHEAFTAMRARGANLTDIVVLVVAADDGVMPQTIEAINHIRAANVPFLVALNKIDKPDVNPDKIKQQLTEYGIVSEEWGGDTIFVAVSAKAGTNMEHLLEMILLLAEVHDLRANPNRYAEGVVIEGRLDKGRGAIATILVQKGSLHVGDFIISGENWCKIRTMIDDKGRRVDLALPSTPVEITGWSDVPEAGEKVQAVDEKVAKEVSALRITERKMEEQKKSSRVTLENFLKMKESGTKELNLIIKGDVQGSIEALSQSLIKLSQEEVKVSVIHMAVGAIKEADVMLATASNAIIIGFNVRPDLNARQFAEKEDIDIRLYRIIYEAIEDVKKAMVGLLDPEYREKYLGRAEVRQVIKVPNIGSIAGSYVIEGKISRGARVRILREGVIIHEGSLNSLRRFKDDVKDVMESFECGIGIKDFTDIKEGDIIEAYVMEEIPRTLN
jgi:translation initiation factor IF-2